MVQTTSEKFNLGLSQQEYETLLEEAKKPHSSLYQKLWFKIYENNFGWLERWFTYNIANGDSRYAEDTVQDAFIIFEQRLVKPPPLVPNALANFIKTVARNLWIRLLSRNETGFDALDGNGGGNVDGGDDNMDGDGAGGGDGSNDGDGGNNNGNGIGDGGIDGGDGTGDGGSSTDGAGGAINLNLFQNFIETETLMQHSFDEAVEFLQKEGKISIEDWWILTARVLWNIDYNDIAKPRLPSDTDYKSKQGELALKRMSDVVRTRYKVKTNVLLEKTREIYKKKGGVIVEQPQKSTKQKNDSSND